MGEGRDLPVVNTESRRSRPIQVTGQSVQPPGYPNRKWRCLTSNAPTSSFAPRRFWPWMAKCANLDRHKKVTCHQNSPPK